MAALIKNDLHIGVLCIDAATVLVEVHGENLHSYILASYVKYLEAAGAKVVPIWINRDRAYYEEIMSKINGILLPGGAVFFEKHEVFRNDCVESSKIIFEIAREKKNFPIFGICLGFQLMILHSTDYTDMNTRICFNKIDHFQSVILTKDFRNSKLFAKLDNELEQAIQKEPCACHSHQYYVTKQILDNCHIADQWLILGIQKDIYNTDFITIVEHKDYPFFGCQFHPERAAYEDTVIYSETAVKFAEYIANFFISQCSMNSNKFPTAADEKRHLIQNYSTTSGIWKECYLFEDNVDYMK